MAPVTASSFNGGNFNRYWYANNNPYTFIDPDGRFGTKSHKGFCEMVRQCAGDNDNSSRRASRSGGDGETTAEDDPFNLNARDKFYRMARNPTEANRFVDRLMFSNDSPLTLEFLLKAGTFTRVAADAFDGDVYGKFSYKWRNFSVSANVMKDGEMLDWSFSMSGSAGFSFDKIQLGYGINLKKIVPFLGRQVGLEFIEANGAAVRGVRALSGKTRTALSEEDPENWGQ